MSFDLNNNVVINDIEPLDLKQYHLRPRPKSDESSRSDDEVKIVLEDVTTQDGPTEEEEGKNDA
jgi:hypothetical protein